MRKKKILISDDEVFISELLKDIIIDLGYELTDIVSNTKSAIESINRNPPDLAILDIKMHGKNQGFEIAEYLQKECYIPFIFLTSFSDKSTVSEASELEPKAFLVKPFNEQNIYSTLEIVFKNLEKKMDYIVIKDGLKRVKILVNEITYIQASDKYIDINTENKKKYVLRETLSGFIENYKIHSLIQVHRSFLINKEKINAVMRDRVIVNNFEIPVSRKYQEHLDSLFS